MFAEATDRLAGPDASALAILPGLVAGLPIFGTGLLVARGVRVGVRRPEERRAPSPGAP